MKANTYHQSNLCARKRAGSVLVTAMIMATIVMVTVAGLHAISMSMPYQVQKQTDAIRAKVLAEAGINHAYSIMRENYTDGMLAFPLKENFGGGSYAVQLVTNGFTHGTFRLISVGSFGDSNARVGADARNTALVGSGAGPSGPNPMSPFRQAIFANGTLNLNGTPKKVVGSLFTNQDFDLSGQYSNFDENSTIYARSFSSEPPEHLQGEWQEQTFPEKTDPAFAAFIEDARNAGTLTEYSGDTSLQQDQVYDGVVVVDGDLTHRGSGTRTINGILYVTGDVTFNGSTSIIVNGSLIAGGNVTFNGASGLENSDFAYDPSLIPPEVIPTPDDHVVIDAWWD